MKNREAITCNGRAAFYACMWEDLRNAALDCGWALGLHGSLASDMDIMAMPWTDEAAPPEDLIRKLYECFEHNPFKDVEVVSCKDMPNNRIVYTMPIWEDFYLDINIIHVPEVSGVRTWKLPTFEEWKEHDYACSGTFGEFAWSVSYMKSMDDHQNKVGFGVTNKPITPLEPLTSHIFLKTCGYYSGQNGVELLLKEWYNKTVQEFHKFWKEHVVNTYLEEKIK